MANKKSKHKLLGQTLEGGGYPVHHSVGDADLLIVNKAVELSETMDTILVCEGTDLIVLILHNAVHNTRKIFFCLNPKQNERVEVKSESNSNGKQELS